MASIRPHRRRDRHWTVEVALGPDPDRPGKYLRREVTLCPPSCRDAEPTAANNYRGHSPVPSLRAKNRAAAERAVPRIEELLAADVERAAREAETPTIAELGAMWLRHVEGRGRKASTLRGYKRIVERIIGPELGHVRIDQVNVAQLEDFEVELAQTGGVNGGGLAPASVMRVHAALRAMFRFAERRSLIDRSPVDRMEPPEQRRAEIDSPDLATIVAFLAAADEDSDWLGVFARLVLATGARRGEILALRWQDVEFGDDGGVVRIRASVDQTREVVSTKTNTTRAVPIEPATVEMLRAHRAATERRVYDESGGSVALSGSSFVFASPEGLDTPRNPDAVSRLVTSVRKRHGLERVWLHGFRHFSASAMVAGGVDPSIVARILGHSSTKLTLDTYASPLDGLEAGTRAIQRRLER